MKSKKFFAGILCAVLLCLLFKNASGQESETKKLMIYPSFGVSIGFFYPSDVNKYVEDYVVSGYIASNYQIYEYLEGKAGLTFRLPKLDFGANFEYDVAPKFGIGENINYSYSRVGPEVFADYFIGNKSGKNAFFIGAGINYSFLWFKDFNASSPGLKLQFGYSMQFKSFNLQPYGAFRYTKANDPTQVMMGEEVSFDGLDLTWTGFQIGVTMSMHKRMLYK